MDMLQDSMSVGSSRRIGKISLREHISRRSDNS